MKLYIYDSHIDWLTFFDNNDRAAVGRMLALKPGAVIMMLGPPVQRPMRKSYVVPVLMCPGGRGGFIYSSALDNLKEIG
jgi:hypothetical protein